MAFPTANIELEQPEKKSRERVVERILTQTKLKLPVFLDSLITLVIVSSYFFWTGLCLALGRELPKEWLKLATTLSKGKVAQKIHDLGKAVEQPKPVTHRVVNIETKQPMVFSGEPGAGAIPLSPLG